MNRLQAMQENVKVSESLQLLLLLKKILNNIMLEITKDTQAG